MRATDSKVGLLLICLTVQVSCSFITKYDDESDPTVIVAASLPLLNSSIIDTKLMAYVGNGHLASTVFDNAIYVNGLYNGARGVSHRARLPNMHNFQIKGDYPTKQYVLDMKNGVFVEQLESDKISIERRVFAHQFFNRLLVTQIVVKRQAGAKGDIAVSFDYVANFTSEDFKFDPITTDGNTSLLKGRTIDIEFTEYQKTTTPVFHYFTAVQDLNLSASQDQLVRTFVSAIDMADQPAKDEMDLAMSLMKAGKDEELYQNHTAAFANIWETGRIELDNLELQRTIFSSYYYLLSSVPAISHNGQLNQFYGLSPGSLSRGSNLTDYQGHSFWDTETWMYPSVLMFYPHEAKQILSYRIHGAEAAAYNAKLFNTSGWRYPWESAFTSLDVTPDCCPEVKLYQLHISGDIAYAARQYLAATRDLQWLQKERGGELIARIAEFWSSRISYSNKKSQYEILGVLPPDEDAQPNVNNSVYTNIIAALSIYHANYTNCLMGASPFDSSAIQKARCLHLPFDEQRQIHLEYEGYNGKQIKQADVVLIGFPLMWPMDYEVRKNDLYYYENLTRTNGPAMTWGMHAIGHIELGDYAKAAELLNRSYTLYVKEPFNIWTEAYQEVGAINFITGAGGFLQTLIFGYGGLRLHVESLRFRGNLPLPPQSTYLYLHKIKYLGSSISFNHTADNIQVRLDSFNDLEPLVLETPNGDIDLKDKNVVNLPKNDVEYVIRAKTPTNCALPYDKIDLKTCSDVNAAASPQARVASLLASVLTTALLVRLIKL